MSLTTSEGLRHIEHVEEGYKEVDGRGSIYGLFVHVDSNGDSQKAVEFVDLGIVSPDRTRQQDYARQVLDDYKAGRLPNDNARLAISLIRFSGMSQCLQDKGL